MKVLGITGGVGSGKSLVLSYLESKENIVVYEADKVARLEQEPGTKCFQEIVEYFGDEIISETGELDRGKLANIVFQDKKMLEKLNAIVHPLVRKKILELIEVHKQQGISIFVYEAAILFEGNYQEICDEVWYIYCEENIRIDRLKKARNYSQALFYQISNQQMSEEMFREKASVIIDNSYDETYLKEQIEKKLGEL